MQKHFSTPAPGANSLTKQSHTTDELYTDAELKEMFAAEHGIVPEDVIEVIRN